jgi:hypothetical protein
MLGEGNKGWFPTLARDAVFRPMRDSALGRGLKVGELVWGLYGASCTWFPASVETVNEDGTYDLFYPLSSRALQEAKLIASSGALLSLPSQAPSEYIPAKPGLDERETLSQVFDLIDAENGGTGSVEVKTLISALKSLAFDRIVNTSVSLSIVFPPEGGSDILQNKLGELCALAEGNGDPNHITKLLFIEYCMVASDFSIFNSGPEMEMNMRR